MVRVSCVQWFYLQLYDKQYFVLLYKVGIKIWKCGKFDTFTWGLDPSRVEPLLFYVLSFEVTAKIVWNLFVKIFIFSFYIIEAYSLFISAKI